MLIRVCSIAGSTTVTNIILRYAVKHNLKVGLPLPRQWELGGYPAKFDSQLVLPRLEQYDVLCHHIRLAILLIFCLKKNCKKVLLTQLKYKLLSSKREEISCT